MKRQIVMIVIFCILGKMSFSQLDLTSVQYEQLISDNTGLLLYKIESKQNLRYGYSLNDLKTLPDFESVNKFNNYHYEDSILTENQSFTDHQSGDLLIQFSLNRLSLDTFFNHNYGMGLNLHYYLGKYFSFESELDIGKEYCHFGTAFIGLPIIAYYWILNDYQSIGSDVTPLSFAGFLICIALAAENLAFHIPVNDNLEFSPYISLLRLKYIYKKGADNQLHLYGSGSAGLKTNIHVKYNFVVSPYVESTYIYSRESYGYNFGINIGYLLKDPID